MVTDGLLAELFVEQFPRSFSKTGVSFFFFTLPIFDKFCYYIVTLFAVWVIMGSRRTGRVDFVVHNAQVNKIRCDDYILSVSDARHRSLQKANLKVNDD